MSARNNIGPVYRDEETTYDPDGYLVPTRYSRKTPPARPALRSVTNRLPQWSCPACGDHTFGGDCWRCGTQSTAPTTAMDRRAA